jgi:DNA-binding transcriptional MerR regulator
MKGFYIGDVEYLLGLPASTLRFWEREVPFLTPKKDVFGRRLYTPLDLCVLSRLKYLAIIRGLGLKTAKLAMERELVVGDHNIKAGIMELKTSLYSLAVGLKTISQDPFIAAKIPAASQEKNDGYVVPMDKGTSLFDD